MEATQIQHELHALGMRLPSRRHLANYYLLIELFIYFHWGPGTIKVHLEKSERPRWEKGGNYFHFASVRVVIRENLAFECHD